MSANWQSRNSKLWQLGIGGTNCFGPNYLGAFSRKTAVKNHESRKRQMNAASDRGNTRESHVKDQVVMALRLIIKAKRCTDSQGRRLKDDTLSCRQSQDRRSDGRRNIAIPLLPSPIFTQDNVLRVSFTTSA
jgi:hypothetical protein